MRALLMVARGKPQLKGAPRDREAGLFAAIPFVVLESLAYQGLSHPAKALLLEAAHQCIGVTSNGHIRLSRKYLERRGWKSVDVLNRARNALLEAELLFETVKGQFPNRESRYALTWYNLADHPDFDHGVALAFRRGAYRRHT